MKTNVRVKKQPVEAKTQPPDIQRRISAGWLKLWRAVYPNTPPPTEDQSLKSKVQSPGSRVPSPESKAQRPAEEGPHSRFRVRGLRFEVPRSAAQRPAAVDYLSRFLCLGFALALFATGCARPRPLKGGKAVTTRKPEGVMEQTIVQSENPSQASKQTQETVKVRTYTVPAGSQMEQSQPPAAAPAGLSTINSHPINSHPSPLNHPSTIASAAVDQPSTINYPPSTAFIVSAPMPVVEREETRAATELGAAQKDTARELGAKLASLKGIVWVGVGLFLFGIASLVWPPLKAVVGSVTTSAAVMAGGLCLMVLPSLIVGNELLILGGVSVAVGGWFLAHRHGQLRGMVAATTGAQSITLPTAIPTSAPAPVTHKGNS